MRNVLVLFSLFILLIYSTLIAQSIPSPRYGHTMVEIDGYLYLFGGDEIFDNDNNLKGGELNDLWKFNPESNEWQELQASGSPQPRYGHGTVIHSGNIYVFGGQNEGNALNDASYYNPDNNLWEQMQDMPVARTDHYATDIGGNLFVFGGRNGDGTQVYGDAYEWDDDTEMWIPKASIPDSKNRYGQSSVPCDEMMYVFGGANESGLFGDMWVYDISYDSWSVYFPPGQRPSARTYSVTAFHDYSWLIVGGVNSTRVNDTWMFDIETNQWIQKSTGPNLIRGAATYVPGTSSKDDDVIFLFGGLNPENEPTNELWKYYIATDTWEQVVYGVDDPGGNHSDVPELSSYPNPFSSSITISFKRIHHSHDLPDNISIYDIRGRCIREISIDSYNLTENQIIWDGKDAYNKKVPSGIYFVKAGNCTPLKILKMR